MGGLRGEGESLESARVDGPIPIVVEGACVGCTLGAVEPEEASADLGGHTAGTGVGDKGRVAVGGVVVRCRWSSDVVGHCLILLLLHTISVGIVPRVQCIRRGRLNRSWRRGWRRSAWGRDEKNSSSAAAAFEVTKKGGNAIVRGRRGQIRRSGQSVEYADGATVRWCDGALEGRLAAISFTKWALAEGGGDGMADVALAVWGRTDGS